jgi:hypothetical protein
MKHMPWKLAKLLIAAITSLAVLSSALPASAAAASIYLTANHATVSSGGSLIVAVYMNGGGNPINAVEADLNYPASKLQYVGLNYGGGAFNISTPGDGGGNGAVSIQNGAINPVSGSGLIATVTFRALVGSGSAAIGVSSSSNLINANTNTPVPFTSSGVSVNFGSGSVASVGSSHSTTTSTPAPPPPPKDTTPPVITDVKLTDLSPFGATITWTTNEPSSSEVDYGLDATYGLSNSSATLTVAHSVALSSEFLLPETVFHYHVKSADAAGNVAVSPDEHFSLPGVPVTVVVIGANGKPEANATVTVDGATSTTNAKGQVTLPSSLGNKKITTTSQGVTIEKTITVDRTVKPLPPYQLDLARQPLDRWMMISVGLFAVVLVLLGIDALLFGSHFFVRLAGLRPALAMVPKFSTDKSGAATTSAPIVPEVTDTVADPPAVDEPQKMVSEAVDSEPAPAAPVVAGFNVQTRGDNLTPPTLRAIDNIQPLSLRPSFTLPITLSAPAASAKRIAVTETDTDASVPVSVPPTPVADVKTPADLPKPMPKKRAHAHKRRKVSKPTSTPPTPSVPPIQPTPEPLKP